MIRSSRVFRLLLASVMAGSAAGQGLHVVPSWCASADAPAFASAAGVGTSERQQILIDEVHLSALVGRDLHAVLLRRDFSLSGALAPTRSNATVHVGIAARTSATALPEFRANLPAPLQVFQGFVDAPGSTDPRGRSVGWDPSDVVEIGFALPFRYGGGTLCIEIDGTVTGAPEWWPVDAVQDGASGLVVHEGHACGTRAAVLGRTASVAEADLVVGRTAIFKLFGEPSRSAFLLIGGGTLPAVIPLDALGAPGCELRVAAFVAIATTLSPPLPDTELGALANLQIHFPSDPGLIGGSFVAQFAEIGIGAVATSNTLRCQLANVGPTTGTSTVWQQPGREPVVHFRRVPVVGLRWR